MNAIATVLQAMEDIQRALENATIEVDVEYIEARLADVLLTVRTAEGERQRLEEAVALSVPDDWASRAPRPRELV